MPERLIDALDDIGRRLAQAPRILLCADFDGTLCPLVDRPEDASLPTGTKRALELLAGQSRVAVAVISGRGRNDLQAFIGLPGLVYAGNHGLEISGPGLFFVEPTAASRSEALHQFAADLAVRIQGVPGAFIEDRGLTLSVHYGQVEPARIDDVRRIVHGVLAATDHPFRLTSGVNRFEVRPRVDWNKGTAVLWIRAQMGVPAPAAIYLGDGVTDEEVFTALEEGITVKVGSPDGTAARYFVDSPTAVLAFLEWLIDRMT